MARDHTQGSGSVCVANMYVYALEYRNNLLISRSDITYCFKYAISNAAIKYGLNRMQRLISKLVSDAFLVSLTGFFFSFFPVLTVNVSGVYNHLLRLTMTKHQLSYQSFIGMSLPLV